MLPVVFCSLSWFSLVQYLTPPQILDWTKQLFLSDEFIYKTFIVVMTPQFKVCDVTLSSRSVEKCILGSGGILELREAPDQFCLYVSKRAVQ